MVIEIQGSKLKKKNNNNVGSPNVWLSISRLLNQLDFNSSGLAEHAWSASHPIAWENTHILSNHTDICSRIIEEAILIRKTVHTLNREHVHYHQFICQVSQNSGLMTVFVFLCIYFVCLYISPIFPAFLILPLSPFYTVASLFILQFLSVPRFFH